MKTIIYTKWISFAVLLLAISLSGCKKSYNTAVPETPETIKELTVNPSFNWKTMRTVTVSITGLAVPVKIRNTFYIKSSDGNAVYFNDLIEMDKDCVISVEVPAHQTKVVASYGTISKVLDITGNNVSFNYSIAQ